MEKSLRIETNEEFQKRMKLNLADAKTKKKFFGTLEEYIQKTISEDKAEQLPDGRWLSPPKSAKGTISDYKKKGSISDITSRDISNKKTIQEIISDNINKSNNIISNTNNVDTVNKLVIDNNINNNVFSIDGKLPQNAQSKPSMIYEGLDNEKIFIHKSVKTYGFHKDGILSFNGCEARMHHMYISFINGNKKDVLPITDIKDAYKKCNEFGKLNLLPNDHGKLPMVFGDLFVKQLSKYIRVCSYDGIKWFQEGSIRNVEISLVEGVGQV